MRAVIIASILTAACGDDPSPVDVDTHAPEVAEVDVTEASDAAEASDTPDVPDPSDVAVEAEVEAEVEVGPPPCEPGTADCDNVQWAEVEAYARATDHHVTFTHTTAVGTYLYVVGGVTARGAALEVFGDVRRAPIGPDHLLGAWEDEATLPTPRAFEALAQTAHAVYLLAGVSQDVEGPFATNDFTLGRLDADGHLTWTPTTALPVEARVHATAHAIGQRLFVIGGSGEAPYDTILVSEIAADGELGRWLPSAPLPAPRTHHASAVHDDAIWIFGGLTTDNAPMETLLRSTHDADGGLTGWQEVGTLDLPPWTHAATLYKDGVFLIGGGQGGPGQERYINRVRFARWQDGVLGPFVDVVKPLPVSRSHVHQAPAFDGYLYSVGGRVMPTGNSIARIFVGYIGF